MAEITRQQVLDHFKTAQAVAEFFGISRQAFYDWGDGPIPELRQLQLVQRIPEVFGNLERAPGQPDEGRAAA
jgi:hypothetical protein